MRYTKLKDWISVFTILYENFLNKSMIDKKLMKRKSGYKIDLQ